jgi:2-methylcitrate dehydratase PrpD
VVALTLLKGVPRLEDFTVEALGNADVRTVRELITVEEDAALTADYPAHYGARIRDVVVRDGYGDPANAMDETAVLAKARALMAWGGMGDEAAEALIAGTLALGEGGALDAYFGGWV